MQAAIRILLIGKGMNGSSRLRNHLVKRDCEIESVLSVDRGLALLQDDSFDLVLAPITMEPGKRSNLIEDLLNSTSHLFFSLSVEDGSWWIPAVMAGKRALGMAAIRSRDFLRTLDRLLLEKKTDRRRAKHQLSQQRTAAVST
jgi:PleD family two-component response regulator